MYEACEVGLWRFYSRSRDPKRTTTQRLGSVTGFNKLTSQNMEAQAKISRSKCSQKQVGHWTRQTPSYKDKDRGLKTRQGWVSKMQVETISREANGDEGGNPGQEGTDRTWTWTWTDRTRITWKQHWLDTFYPVGLHIYYCNAFSLNRVPMMSLSPRSLQFFFPNEVIPFVLQTACPSPTMSFVIQGQPSFWVCINQGWPFRP